MEVNTLAIEGEFLDEFDLFKTFERPEESCLVMFRPVCSCIGFHGRCVQTSTKNDCRYGSTLYQKYDFERTKPAIEEFSCEIVKNPDKHYSGRLVFGANHWIHNENGTMGPCFGVLRCENSKLIWEFTVCGVYFCNITNQMVLNCSACNKQLWGLEVFLRHSIKGDFCGKRKRRSLREKRRNVKLSNTEWKLF